jgi:hypothetical protein
MIAWATQYALAQDGELYLPTIHREEAPIPGEGWIVAECSVASKGAPANLLTQHAGLPPEMVHLLARQHERVHFRTDRRVVSQSDVADSSLDADLRRAGISRVVAESKRQAGDPIPRPAEPTEASKPLPLGVECVRSKRRPVERRFRSYVVRAHPVIR